MLADKDFILAIKLYPDLYKAYKGDDKDGEKNIKSLWSQFARENNFKSGAAAELKWRQLISKYVSFLMYGTHFPFEREMQFMQMPLLGAGLDDAQSDSDIDEVELKKVLNIYEECPTDIKKHYIRNDMCNEVLKNPTQSKEQGNELCKTNNINLNSSLKNTEKHYETKDVKSEDTENKILSKPKETNTVSTENTTNTVTTTTNAQTANNSSGDASAPSGFTNLSSLELIFLGYAKVLQRMPLRLQLQTKRKIADIMDEAELELFEGN
ncbi:uncharacterized protein LOC105219351 [Zeugodacus cucurbitae]|uniref:MADF domain-containing protein n=1 Tax=Zeugodacus cucurbitae TaxID=28588 RepID=A0A0A1XLX4_ZEUCU|nr:uncharacterized protein LOC105219351 [Zeugodacus cucurbitae]